MAFLSRRHRPDTSIIKEGGYQPTSDPGPVPPSLVRDSGDTDAPFELTEEGVKVLSRWSDVLKPADRRKIVEFVLEDEASPIEMAEALGKDLATTAYHVRCLEKEGVLERARLEQREGSVEHFYRLSDDLLPLLRGASVAAGRQVGGSLRR
ncbi:MAG TPA: winged helix-turn-helix domain-containing protein [Solirubrobacterales bacterium]|jgi:DNA-binding transcriptional ArsR family regulator